MALAAGRAALEGDRTLVGRSLCRAYSDLVDGWLAELLAEAEDERGAGGVALVAVGGYGRAELSLQSDIDVVLLHTGRSDIGTFADRIWYPIWDEGLKLGHAVRTGREALALAADDLDTATSLLHVRHLAGDEDLTDDLARRSLEQWQKRAKRWLEELSRRVRSRHEVAGEVAFLLEPDLKEGRGGLRDVHALHWAEAARHLLWEGDDSVLESAYDALLSARVELHRRTGRPGDRLLLEEQDAVAAALHDGSADALMHRLAAAARTIAWRSDDAWQRIDASLSGPLGWRSRRDKSIGDGLVLRDGEVHLTADADPGADPSLVLRAAAAAASGDTRIHRSSLDRLAERAGHIPEPWPAEVRTALVDLLLAGHHAIPVVEALDQMGLWVRVLPEWEAVRSKPQRNAYHRFTVDRHLMEACANASQVVARTDRPDLLVLGALLHDLGKGYPGDHTEVGIELLATIGPRMGFAPADVAVLQSMVRHHLLLPDVATRRDLDDPATVEAVAEAVGDQLTLGLLACLTEADSLATGPAAWGRWKADLVRDLVARVTHVLGGGTAEEVRDDFPTAEHVALLRAGRLVLNGDGDRITIVAPDRQGLFSRVTGVLALHGLAVLDAAVTSLDGMALEVLRVESSFGPTIAWDGVIVDIERVLEGRLALQARLAERAKIYGTRQRRAPAHEPPRVVVDNTASRDATVVEVHAVDSIGVLYRITRALAELELNIVSAKVQTLGERVVDAFYVRDTAGNKLLDPATLVEVERALLHELASCRLPPHPRLTTRVGSSPWSRSMVEHRDPPTRQDLVRWSESLSAIARTGLGFTQSLYEQERFEEVLHIAADMRASLAADAELDVEHYVDEWMRNVGDGVAGYVTPKSAIGAVVYDDQGRILLVQRADSGVWLYPTGWADVGYSPAEVAVKEVLEETGIHCEPQGVIAVLDGMRMGMTRIPLYSTVFLCRATGGDLTAHPLETSDVGWFAEDELPAMTVGLSQWGDHAFAAIRGEAVPVLFDPPRAQPWHKS